MKRVGGSKSTLGNMNRTVAVRPATVAAANPVQASVIHLRVDLRVTPSILRSGREGGVSRSPAPVRLTLTS